MTLLNASSECTNLFVDPLKQSHGYKLQIAEVIFHTRDNPGQQERLVTMKTNYPVRVEITFNLKAYVSPVENNY